MRNATEKYEKRMMQISMAIMEQLGFMGLTINRMAEITQQPIVRLKNLFIDDDNLRILTMKHAAIIWCEKICEDVKMIQDNKGRIMFMIEQFVFGTDMHASFLSCYIDVWYYVCRCRVSESKTDWIRHSLVEIYKLFEKTLISVVGTRKEISDLSISAWLLVILSDSIHIQQMLGKDMDREKVCSKLYNLLMC